MSRPNALLIEDAPEFVLLVGKILEREGYNVETTGRGQLGVAAAHAKEPELVVLDVGLPDTDGFDVCRQLREFSDAYIIMLTGRTDEIDRVVGLEIGADDYVTKPFSPRELGARIKAMKRRPRVAPTPGVRKLSSLVVDVSGREAFVNGSALDLTKIEFDLLELLTSNPGQTFTKAQILDRVWGSSWFGDTHVIDVHLGNLRKKIGDGGRKDKLIRTVRGVGYRFVAA